MKLFKDIRYYLKKYGLLNLLRRAPGQLARSVRPFLYRTRIKVTQTRKYFPIRFFTYVGLPSRINLILQDDNNNESGADHAVILAIMAASRCKCALRVISCPPFNTNRFHRLLISSGLKLVNNVEIVPYEPDADNGELDISRDDIFITDSWLVANRIISSVNGKNVICLIQPNDKESFLSARLASVYAEVLKNHDVHFVVSGKQLYENLVKEVGVDIDKKGIWIEPNEGTSGYIKLIDILANVPAMAAHRVHS